MSSLPLDPTLPVPNQGNHTITCADSNWGIVCPYHRGESVVDEQPVIDPETGKNRVAEQSVRVGDTTTTQEVEVLFPVYSEDVGFQPDCFSCLVQLQNTHQHIHQHNVDVQQRQFEDAERIHRLIQAMNSDDPEVAKIAGAQLEWLKQQIGNN